jgi:transcription elongation factor Elf1
MEYKTLLVEKLIDCPNCGQEYTVGGILYLDEYRGDTCCPICIDNYEEEIIKEEGEYGRLLK